MAQRSIIDSHIHLWPQEAANPHGHGWMAETPTLATQHVLDDYIREIGPGRNALEGVVYIETDRRYTGNGAQPLEQWAAGPLKEIRFLRSIVEGNYGPESSSLLKGIVLWAPVDRGLAVFEEWLRLAQQTAGHDMWQRVKGFRFLLQGLRDRAEYEKLVFSQDFLDVLAAFGAHGRDHVFDVGVDQQQAGVWQLRAWTKILQRLRSAQVQTRFVFNHLCKPDLKTSGAVESDPDFVAWRECVRVFSRFEGCYMKFSGGFSQMALSEADFDPLAVTRAIKPWTDAIFDLFGPKKIMFGSDWPVCNLSGPRRVQPWAAWTQIVQATLEQNGLSESDRERVWAGTAKEAYRLQ